jgi:hypothetical protein
VTNVDLLSALLLSVERARAVRNEPCPVCGGDRLRPDYTGSGHCHAGRSPDTNADPADPPALVDPLTVACAWCGADPGHCCNEATGDAMVGDFHPARRIAARRRSDAVAAGREGS